MKNLGLVLFSLLLAAVSKAQLPYFIYFETDDARPFYVKMEDRVYSSSDIGYFILPNLADSNYSLSIGFPSTPDVLRFDVPLRGGDRGFSIRRESSGTILYDLESQVVIRARDDDWKNKLNYQYRNDEFTSLLARASNDTSLFYVPIYSSDPVAVKPVKAASPERVPDNAPPAETRGIDTTASVKTVTVDLNTNVSPDSGLIVKNDPGSVVSDTVLVTATPTSDTVLVRSVDVVHTDSLAAPAAGVPADTLLHSASPVALAQADSAFQRESDTVMVPTQPIQTAETESAPAYRRSAVRKHSESSTTEGFGMVFYDDDTDGIDTIRIIIPNTRVQIADADTVVFADGMIDRPGSVKPAVTRRTFAPCREVASDKDFFKLRRNMVGRNSEQDMLEEARNAFRSRCFSAQHLKNLSSLFLNDSSKYLFFELAYAHVTDRENFPFLSAELKDAVYQDKFKSLIEQ